MDSEFVKGMDELSRRLQNATEYFMSDVPDVIGTEATVLFKKNFEDEGFNGNKWAARKSLRPGGTNGQKVLSKSGELSESIDYKLQGNTVIIYSDKPYAQVHNEGGTIPVTKQMRKYFWAQHYMAAEARNEPLAEMYKHMALSKQIVIPKREYIGDSPELVENIANKIVRDLLKILNGEL